MEKKILKTPAVLSGTVRKVDNSLSFRFVGTIESSKEERDLADELFQQSGWLIFVGDDTIPEVEIPQDNTPTDRETKTPRQRLRGVSYAYFIESGGKKEDYARWFTAWDDKQTEKLIQEFKDKLNS